ncbi:hypothetical protein INT45_000557 [Circinella minor]|uniref:Uncharacterized protein n=1 Tax=Circinella minor TaxID=1195481 RepID=A0A8H7VTD1_9FUNG|nr:hypothetical protein INT45_000557 [Circinella minor]
MISAADKVLPVTIKLTHRYIQSVTTRRQKLFSGCSAILNDIFSISDLDDITIALTNSDYTQEIRFKYRRTQTNVIFSAPSSAEATQFVFVFLQKTPVSPVNQKLMPTTVNIKPEDVPGALINMVLLNMGSQNEELRRTAYIMLSSVGRAFGFVLAHQYVETKAVCIPKNDTEQIIGISTKLAFTQDELTFEVFREWSCGYKVSDESDKRLCIKYIVPWLANLGKIYSGSSGDEEVVAKTKEVVHMLLDTTVSANETLRDFLFTRVWKTIGENSMDSNSFIDLVLTEVTDYAYKHDGVGSIQTEIIADIVVSMFNMTVCKKILTRLHNTFLATAFNWTHSLVHHPSWQKCITILIRFVLMGSFYYRGPVRDCAPEVVHVIAITAGIGTTLERETLHSMMVNFKQALCIIDPNGGPEKTKLMREKLARTASIRRRLLFGLTKTHTTPYTATSETLTDTVDTVDLYNIETIIDSMNDGIESVAPNIDTLNAWRARWLSLASSLAFQFNPAIQPRAYLVIGCLAGEGIDDELLYQILNSLQQALVNAHFELVQAIIMCLRRIVSSIPPDSCYLLSLFWISLALFQIDHRPLFSANLELLSGVCNTLQDHGMTGPGNKNLSQLLLEIRKNSNIIQEHDRELGVNFEHYFSFGVSTVLLKSAIHDVEMLNALKPTVEDFLTIEMSQWWECVGIYGNTVA